MIAFALFITDMKRFAITNRTALFIPDFMYSFVIVFTLRGHI